MMVPVHMRFRYSLALTFLLLPAAALATVYVPADFTEMVAASRFVVHGTIVDSRAEPTADRTGIVTFVTVDVAQPLKGTPGQSITFRVPGGQVGRYRRVIVGAPEFERGDEVVLFLTSRGPSFPYVFGLSQGVYRVSRSNGRAIVVPPPISLREGSAPGLVVRGDPARRTLPLDEFAREVRAAMERAR
jgi:hypothetical protein